MRIPLPARTTVEWVRFEHEAEPYGVFSYLEDARKLLSPGECDEIDCIMKWFNDKLTAPGEAERRRSWTDRERFWFRAEATEHLQRAQRLMELVRAAGIPILERRTRRMPGKSRWEDADQVAVITFRDSPRPKRGSP